MADEPPSDPPTNPEPDPGPPPEPPQPADPAWLADRIRELPHADRLTVFRRSAWTYGADRRAVMSGGAPVVEFGRRLEMLSEGAAGLAAAFQASGAADEAVAAASTAVEAAVAALLAAAAGR